MKNLSRALPAALTGALLMTGCAGVDGPSPATHAMDLDHDWEVEMGADVPTITATETGGTATGQAVMLDGTVDLWDVPLCDYTPADAGIVAELVGSQDTLAVTDTACTDDTWVRVTTGDSTVPEGWIYMAGGWSTDVSESAASGEGLQEAAAEGLSNLSLIAITVVCALLVITFGLGRFKKGGRWFAITVLSAGVIVVLVDALGGGA